MASRRILELKKPTLVDLFCGCGGLTLGAQQAGFRSALSVDYDRILTHSFERNFPDLSLEIADIAALQPRRVKDTVGGEVDGVIGGPPCQGFSAMGRQDESDPRRGLLLDFFRLIRGIKPKFFLMENVLGLEYSKNYDVLTRGLELLPKRYEVISPMRLDSAQFGAATSRPRIFVVGFDRERMDPLNAQMFVGAKEPVTVQDAIADLRKLEFVGYDQDEYDMWSLGPSAKVSDYACHLRGRERVVTGHRKTPHRKEITKRFAAVRQGERDEIGKHIRLSWKGQCPTLRAGTGADRGSYQSVRPIHPSEPRVITVREAARLQGFPDWFRFHPTIWHSFRMIGNSVSPIIARQLFSAIAPRLRTKSHLQAAE
jgi:DNA (cytosine-5)-methyltransferase 1